MVLRRTVPHPFILKHKTKKGRSRRPSSPRRTLSIGSGLQHLYMAASQLLPSSSRGALRSIRRSERAEHGHGFGASERAAGGRARHRSERTASEQESGAARQRGNGARRGRYTGLDARDRFSSPTAPSRGESGLPSSGRCSVLASIGLCSGTLGPAVGGRHQNPSR